jgi:hypothetical protein
VKCDDYSCVTINSFSDFEAKVKGNSGDMIFCAFTILDIENNINLICMESGQCCIKGSRHQMRIIGPTTQVFIQCFFIFEAASANAVQIFQCHVKEMRMIIIF